MLFGFLKIPAEEEIEISALADGLKIGPFGEIESQYGQIGNGNSKSKTEASVKLSETIFPGVADIEEERAPDGGEVQVANRQSQGKIIDERESQLAIYEEQIFSIKESLGITA